MSDRLLVVSSDCHAGLPPARYRDYLDPEFREAFDASPEAYIAQPLVEFSSHPTYVDGTFAPRRVDLRPFVLYGEHIKVLPGGLTRVALEEGSYVVNSSQGGGSKDTWILADLPGESKS